MDFFNHLHNQASKLMKTLEESQKQKSDRAETFEKTFKVSIKENIYYMYEGGIES